MTLINQSDRVYLSRRTVFRHAAVMVGGGALLGLGFAAGDAAAATKMAPKAVSYQDKPKGRARCDGCTQWQGPDACKIVSGTISPAGWCTLYAAKA